MKLHLIFFACLIYVAFRKPYLSKWPDKIKVNKENQHEFGLPIGTVLKKDKRAGLYIPPPISDNFTPEDRLEIQFANIVTRRNLCRVCPGVDETRITRKFYWNTFCRDSDGEDICCGDTKCSCDLAGNNCACLKPETYEHVENQKNSNFNKTLAGVDTFANAVGKIVPAVAGAVKGK